MSTRNLIDAIASGSALDIESAFEDTMAEKVSVQIEAKRLQIAQTMFTTEEVDLDEEQLDEDLFTGGRSYHPTLSGKLDRLRSIHKKLTSSGYTTNSSKHLSTPKYEIDHMGHKEVTYRKPGQSDVTVNHGGYAKGGPEFYVGARKESTKKSNLPEESSLDEEQLDELSPKTLGSYVKKATSHGQGSADGSIHNLATQAADDYHSGIEGGPEDKKSYKRSKGIARAVNKLTKEETEEQSEQE